MHWAVGRAVRQGKRSESAGKAQGKRRAAWQVQGGERGVGPMSTSGLMGRHVGSRHEPARAWPEARQGGAESTRRSWAGRGQWYSVLIVVLTCESCLRTRFRLADTLVLNDGAISPYEKY